MPYCLSPTCASPQNSAEDSCQSCGTALRLHQRYQALKPIGQGGFGRTFLAVDLAESMKPRCVIKQLYPQQQGVELQAKASDLFRQEAQQLLTAGQYPSIPTFLDYFEQDGFQYLVQEYIEGQNLAEILKSGQVFKESEVKALLETMLETIDFLHHHKIIHRDIKPANIIRSPNGRFILVDLGAAKLATGTALGQTGTVIGSAEYVAPEQLRGKAIFASDLYSLGATCVTLLTGMSPFSLFDTSTGAWEWRDYLVQNPVSEPFGKILDRMLIGPTKLRYGSADEVLEDLEVKKLGLVKEDAIDSLHQEVFVQTKEKTAELGIEPTQPGEIVEKRGDRQNTKRLIKIMLFLGVSLMWPIGALIIANLNPEIPTVKVPASMPPVEQTQTPEGTTYRPYSLSDLIKPDHTRPISPYKIIKNLPLFSSIVIKDSEEVILSRKISDKQLTISNLNINTEAVNSIKLPGLYKQDYPSTQFHEQTSIRNGFLIHLTPMNMSNDNKMQEIKIWNMGNNKFTPVETPSLVNGQSLYLNTDGIIHEISNAGEFKMFSISKNGTFINTRKLSFKGHTYIGAPATTPDLKGLFTIQGDSSGKDYENKFVYQDIETGREIYSFSPGDIWSPISNADFNVFTISQDPRRPFLVIKSSGAISGIGTPLVTEKLSKLNPYTRGTPGYKSVDLKQVGQGDDSVFHVFDIEAKKILYTFSRPGRISHVSISPDSNTLIILEQSVGGVLRDVNAHKYTSKLTVWDLKTGRFLREIFIVKKTSNEEMSYNEQNLAANTGPVLQFTPDSKKLILGIPSLASNGIPLPKAIESGISIWNVDELRNP